jgi:hypothetical protein
MSRHCSFVTARSATTLRMTRSASSPAAREQIDDRERDLAFAQVAADRLAERALVRGVVEQVVDQLERDAEVEAELASACSCSLVTAPSTAPICAQPPNR